MVQCFRFSITTALTFALNLESLCAWLASPVNRDRMLLVCAGDTHPLADWGIHSQSNQSNQSIKKAGGQATVQLSACARRIAAINLLG